MRKITFSAILVLISTFSFAATGWFNDFLTISTNGASTPNNYFLSDATPASGATALQGKAFGLVTSLEITGADMKYWSDSQDRTGAAFYYKITNASNTFNFVPATEIIMDQVSLGGNDYQGTKTTTINLLAGLPSGAYQLHVWAKSWSGEGGQGDSWLTNNSANYVATFMKMPASTAPMSGTYKVGDVGNADFNSLSAVINAVNMYGVGGDILFEIATSLIETDLSLGVNTGAYKLTIKPAATTTPTVTFTNTGSSVNIDGHFVIGSPSANSASLIPTNNVTIDGSNIVNGTTKDLTFVGSASSVARGVIRIFGNCDDITIKNCIITGKNTSGNNNGCVHVTNYHNGTAGFIPDRLIIENNTLTNVDGNGAACVHISQSGSPTVGLTALKVKNNVMNGRVRAMFISYTNDGDITGNTISEISQTSQGSAAITLQTNFGTAGTFNIANNKITTISTINVTAGANNGVIGIDNQCVTPKIVNIYNNMLSGFAVGNAATTNSKIYGIRSTSTSTCNIFNNTILIPEMTNMTAFGSSYIAGIVFATAATTEAGPATTGGITTVKNNIIISNETTMKVWGIRRVGTGANFVSDNNIIYAATTNNFTGFFNASDAADLAAWRTASSQDAASKSVDVSFENAATGDLRIASASYQDANLQVVRLTDYVPKDIFGTDRDYYTYAGAHQAQAFLINENINPKNVTARIIRTSSGIEVQLDREANIELYTINGMLIDNARVNGTYSRNLNAGIYIIRIDGKATKFVK